MSLADGCLPSRLIRMDSSRSSRLDGYVEAFQDAQKYDLQTDSPTATRYGFRVASQACSLDVLGFTPFRLENCLPSGGNIRLRPPRYPCSVASDIGLPHSFRQGVQRRPARVPRQVGLQEGEASWKPLAKGTSLFSYGCSTEVEEPSEQSAFSFHTVPD